MVEVKVRVRGRGRGRGRDAVRVVVAFSVAVSCVAQVRSVKGHPQVGTRRDTLDSVSVGDMHETSDWPHAWCFLHVRRHGIQAHPRV
jgi:hypothetical protein